MADSTNPIASDNLSATFLPRFYRTDANKKFLQATVNQLVQPGSVQKVSGYVGRQNSKATTHDDVFVDAANSARQQYQLEPGFVVKDPLNNTTFFKDYQDYINQISVFGGNVNNHARLNKQEFYSWDPHINWDKFVNFQNYYWLPNGPNTVNVHGNIQKVESTYTVVVENEGDNNEYLFTPNGLSRNPTLTLYRGQTYNFNITSPGNPFSFKTKRSTGFTDRYRTAGLDSAVEVGSITFTVPNTCPDVLYYVSETDIILGGVVQILDLNENSSLDIDTEFLGKKTYILKDGTPLSNGMKIAFVGNVSPAKYATGKYYVEGVGTAITLVSESDLEILTDYTLPETILFDSNPFDSKPFSDAISYASTPDYVVIDRASKDRNAWSRYNRWFHTDVIEISATINGITPTIDQSARAVRPIIEFDNNLKLFNFGTHAVTDIDLIDDFTTDAFSIIEGSAGYNVDGVNLANGHRILFTADTDNFVRNNIYRVEIVNLYTNKTDANGVPTSSQIHLVLDDTIEKYHSALIHFGAKNQGKMYWFNGTDWKLGQQKTKLNQQPLFDIVDDTGISFSDTSKYSGSTFLGTHLFSYKIGSGKVDKNLGFALSYKNINNIGDIVFNFSLMTDSFQYEENSKITTKSTNVGFLVKTNYNNSFSYVNGWQICTSPNTQAAVRVYKNSTNLNNFKIDLYDDIETLDDLVVRVYVNGIRLDQLRWSIATDVTTNNIPIKKTIILANDLTPADVLSIRTFSSQSINANGYYEIPVNLQSNPFNKLISEFTLGEVIDHVTSIVDNLDSFRGNFPGASNIRDLGNISQFGTKFVQHSGPIGLSLYHVTSSTKNIVRALEYSRDRYNEFKRGFIITATSLGIHTDPISFVNQIMREINKDIPKNSSFYFSDMVPYGASLKTSFTVLDYRIQRYSLANVFDLSELSNKAVGVYLNDEQLLHGKDYTFDSQGFVIITATKHNDDVITIYEYESTDGNFVPETPTKLGIWPKYEPKIYLDTTLITPCLMIQGHDGSQILAYGDYRDNLILELEKRIYNNIKVKYDPTIFDIGDVVPSYNRSNDYSLTEFNEVLAPSFYKWLSHVDQDFTMPLNFNNSNPLTYNYIGQRALDNRLVPGYWRGVYRWMLDTDRPNLCPWEMLGLSEEPAWWVTLYGPAPYTADNLVMWDDISKGLLKELGKPAVKLEKYAKPFLINHIPVDSSGNVISPQASGLAFGTNVYLTDTNFKFGDVSPVESAWRRSSYYPFSVLIASMLLTPARTIGVLLDRSQIVRDLSGQIIYKASGLRISPADIVIPSTLSDNTRVQTAGLINYIVNYILSDTLKSLTEYRYDLTNITSQLCYRVGAFTSKEKFNLLLDSKNPISAGSVFVPQEDYEVILNTSSPIKKLSYSGVIITKINNGFSVKGYSKTQPYFKVFSPLNSGNTVTVGGISESYMVWSEFNTYSKDKVVQFKNNFFRVLETHDTTSVFDVKYYAKLSSLPVVGGRSAIFRTSWNKKEVVTYSYGSIFFDIQGVVDFLIGYGEYLKSQGFIFDEFNSELNRVANWGTSAREFLFWTSQNWSSSNDKWTEWSPGLLIKFNSIVRWKGEYYRAIRIVQPSLVFDPSFFEKLDGLSIVGSSVISLSPAAEKVAFSTHLSTVDDISNTFNDYEICGVDGRPVMFNFLNSFRADQSVSYSPKDNSAIYGAAFYLVQTEHVILINNLTMFNDTIFNPESGYKQDRIKVSGYVSSNWNGSLNVPGFIVDQGIVKEWNAWSDYAIGDVVKHKEFYYSANVAIAGTEKFDSSQWIKLDSKPKSALLANWTYKASQFEDFYSLDTGTFDSTQQKMAQHLIGYQKRQYLENIIQDDVSEYKFYQGMIIEKGTQNVFNKLFDVLSADNQESLTFFEEWAIRMGQYGANAAFENIEIILNEDKFITNPQGVELVNSINPKTDDFIIRQTPSDLYIKPVGYSSNPWPVANSSQFLRSAGHVRADEVQLTVKAIDDIATADINSFTEGDYVWCTFEGMSWNVYRYTDPKIKVKNIVQVGQTVVLTINRSISLPSGSYIGIKHQSTLNGFFKVILAKLNTITIKVPTTVAIEDPVADLSSTILYTFNSRKASSINTADAILPRHIGNGELLWTDNSENNNWATWKYNTVYQPGQFFNPDPAFNLEYGRGIATSTAGDIIAVSTAAGFTYIFDRSNPTTEWVYRQQIFKPFIYPNDIDGNNINTQLANNVTMSNDGRWLVTSSPFASAAFSNYVGVFSEFTAYSLNNIVLYNNLHYQAIVTTVSAKQYPSMHLDKWKKVPYIPVDLAAQTSSLLEQGVISLYEKDSNNIYQLVDSIVSPQPVNFEHFGSNIAFAGNSLLIKADGQDGKTKLYNLTYGTSFVATSSFDPNGSIGTKLVLTSIANIEVGMAIVGIGFVDGQTVTEILANSTINLSAAPTEELLGTYQFTKTEWKFNLQNTLTDDISLSHFGETIVSTIDGRVLAVSAPTPAGSTGNVYIYAAGGTGFTLVQTLGTAENINRFGTGVTISNTGTYLAISAMYNNETAILPTAGTVLIYKNSGTAGSFEYFQTLTNVSPEAFQAFGSKLYFTNDFTTLVVYSENADSYDDQTFDLDTTTFDLQSTLFRDLNFDCGRVDIYDRYDATWTFSESITTPAHINDGYGRAIAVNNHSVLVGAPYSTNGYERSGNVYEFINISKLKSWVKIHEESDNPDVFKIKQAFLYNTRTLKLLTYLDILDPIQGKHPGTADQEVKYRLYYDPAIYSTGTAASVNIDEGIAWTTVQVGQLWWDLTTAKFIDSYDTDVVYRNNTWCTLAVGASIDIYEWVESKYKPSDWDLLADTEEGLALDISGTTLYGDTAYSVKTRFDTISKTKKFTYYYWVKNKKTVPDNNSRRISAYEVSSLISNPRGNGYKFLALTGTNSFSLINVKDLLDDDNVALSIEYWTVDKTDQNIHTEWKLINSDSSTSIPATIEQKWIDSLCGKDVNNRDVPDMSLPIKLRYGIESRPRQGMFVNRFEALKQYIEQVNIVLGKNLIVDSCDITSLYLYDQVPNVIHGKYDQIIDTYEELRFILIKSYKKPELLPIIVDGKITGVEIIDSGRGYLVAPTIEVVGNGINAVVGTTINAAGRIISCEVVNSGEGYNDNTTLIVRNYSVLLLTDSQSNNVWSIYSYQPETLSWSKVISQSYDVRKYWNTVDWYASGYNQFNQITHVVDTYADLNSVSALVGETVKIRTTSSGNWVLLEKFANTDSINWTQSYKVIGSQNGTIQLSSTLYKYTSTDVGFDGIRFDGGVYDNSAAVELRLILDTIKKNILINELKSEYLNLFFSTVRYVLSEQAYVDWIFKTSFVKANHNVGSLRQLVTYKNDNLQNFEDYVSEVKPYRTQIREYVSVFSKVENTQSAISDFDLPVVYNAASKQIAPIATKLVENDELVTSNSAINEYPWKFWLDNLGFSIMSLEIVDSGSGYISAPIVTILNQHGTSATARAFITNGKVSRIILLTKGKGYRSAPTVTLDGGLNIGGSPARAVAIIGDSVIRSNLIKMKFDRLTQTYFITQLQETETFVGSGSRAQFSLTWAPDIRVGTSTVMVNGLAVLKDSYVLKIIKLTSRGYTSYQGSLIFNTPPAINSKISITYLKNWNLLNAADRAHFYYNPTSGQLGNDLAQLMGGIDYGGVIVNGLGFEFNQGWDGSPYFSDNWDSVDQSFDDYSVTVAADTYTMTLPYIPAQGTYLNVYHVQSATETFNSNGADLIYYFSNEIATPTVTVVKSTVTLPKVIATKNVVGVTTLSVNTTVGIEIGDVVSDSNQAFWTTKVTMTHTNSVSNVIFVSSTENMSINTPLLFSGKGFGGIVSGVYYVKTIVSETSLTISSSIGGAVFDIQPGVDNTTVSVGAMGIVFGTFNSNTTVVSIDNDTDVTLNQMIYADIATATTIKFTRVLTTANNIFMINDGQIELKVPVTLASDIIISGYRPAIRLDDPNYNTPLQTNDNAIMQTISASGTSDIVTIPNSLTVADGDKFIIRKSTSDGATDIKFDDYDTALSGGNLAYTTASGIAAEDIVVDGDGFITPMTSFAPDEVVPGQIVDAVAIKVFDKARNSSANINIDAYIADGALTQFEISQFANSTDAIIVKQSNALTSTVKTATADYVVDYKNRIIEFITPPTATDTITIISFGFSGEHILDINYKVSDGTLREFSTNALWEPQVSSLIYVNGEAVNAELFKIPSSSMIGFRLVELPKVGDVINYVIVEGTEQTFSTVKTQKFPATGVIEYPLTNLVGNSLPLESSMIVKIGQNILNSPNNSYFEIKNNKLNYSLDKIIIPPYSANIEHLSVFANGILLEIGIDYIVDLSGITIKINKNTYSRFVGKTLTVSVADDTGYVYIPATSTTVATLRLSQIYDIPSVIEVTTFFKHDVLDMHRSNLTVIPSATFAFDSLEYYQCTDVKTGTINLDRAVIDDRYVWVIHNGTLLIPSIDFKLNDDKTSVRIFKLPELTDNISLITFSSNVDRPAISYMQFKDMLNRTHFKRLNLSKQTWLVKELSFRDITITVNDASNFDQPTISLNKPGIIEINGERIEFFTVNGNVLGQLRRGTLGTGTPKVHPVGEFVQEISASETIPYTDSVIVEQHISDGTNIVNLTFAPTKSTDIWTYSSNFVSSIPLSYGQANDIEVFVGGYSNTEWVSGVSYSIDDVVIFGSYSYRCSIAHTSGLSFDTDKLNWVFFIGNIRLKKIPYSVHNVNTHLESPEGDIQFDADFAVDGNLKQLRLTNKLEVGTRITVVKRVGKSWDSTTSISDEESKIANFIKAVPGSWYTHGAVNTNVN